MKTRIATLFAVIFSILIANGQESIKRIDTLIEKAVKINRFNGSVLVSKNGKIIFEKAYGYQDAEKHILNTPNTIYQIGLSSKD